MISSQQHPELRENETISTTCQGKENLTHGYITSHLIEGWQRSILKYESSQEIQQHDSNLNKSVMEWRQLKKYIYMKEETKLNVLKRNTEFSFF